jgi:hypothetical protein
VVEVMLGAEGTVNGRTAADTEEFTDDPSELWARTRNLYDTPFVRPVTVVDVESDTPSAKVVHEIPLSDVRSIS